MRVIYETCTDIVICDALNVFGFEYNRREMGEREGGFNCLCLNSESNAQMYTLFLLGFLLALDIKSIIG